MNKFLIVLFVGLGLAGCATTKQNVPAATMDTLKVGNALIRVERESGLVGSGRSTEVTDNGVIVGQLSPGNSITWERPSGTLVISLAPAKLAVKNLTPLRVDAISGQEYEFRIFWSWEENSFVIKQK